MMANLHRTAKYSFLFSMFDFNALGVMTQSDPFIEDWTAPPMEKIEKVSRKAFQLSDKKERAKMDFEEWLTSCYHCGELTAFIAPFRGTDQRIMELAVPFTVRLFKKGGR